MRIIKGLIAGLLAAGRCRATGRQSRRAGFAPDRLERITAAFQGYVDSAKIPGAVLLVARKDKIAYVKAIGFRDREAREAMQPDTIFRIASMTKPIVSVAAMMLAEEGKLDIGAPVAQYLPELNDLRDRASHPGRSDPADDRAGLAAPHVGRDAAARAGDGPHDLERAQARHRLCVDHPALRRSPAS